MGVVTIQLLRLASPNGARGYCVCMTVEKKVEWTLIMNYGKNNSRPYCTIIVGHIIVQ